MPSCPYPIAVMSFNRPDLLELVLQSLQSQSISIDPAKVYLFQDGQKGKDGRDRTDVTLIQQCVAVFLKIFPTGNVVQASENLGVALNYSRAESLFFLDHQDECAIFIEDDLILDERYFSVLMPFIDFALKEEMVSYVAAYGDHHATGPQQAEQRNRVVQMRHKWGFALTRRQWEKQREIIEGYLAIVGKSDYDKRDSKSIREYFAGLGYMIDGTSQDAAKDLASLVLGTVKIMPYACFGKYIGRVGLHSTPQLYRAEGYEGTTLFEGAIPDFEWPSRSTLDAWLQSNRQQARHVGEQHKTIARSTRSAPINMSPSETDCLISYLKKAKHYLQFGFSGAVYLALNEPITTVLCVDTHSNTLIDLEQDSQIRQALRNGRLSVYHADIGTTSQWGVPTDQSKIKSWPGYYLNPWLAKDHEFDVILIDGRFRVMCALVALMYVPDHAIVLIHDYSFRQHYQIIEKYYDIVQSEGSLFVLQKRSRFNYVSWMYDFGEHMFDFR